MVSIHIRATGRLHALTCALLACLLLVVVPAAQANGGGNNRGDVWTDNVGQPPGPGHEQDPHLACANINLWGDGMADSSGTYTINGIPPSGSGKQAYSSTWSYNQSTGGTQVLSVIDVKKLVDAAVQNGDAPQNKQGYHFKLEFSQNPQKHKTFWVNCPAPTPPPPSCGETHTCPPPPSCGETHTCPPPPSCHETHTCPPPPSCGETHTCPPPVVQPGPTTVVIVKCPCNCPPATTPGSKPTPTTPVAQKPKPKCPKVKKSQIKVSFTPKHLKHGNLHANIKVPASWHLKKIALAICTPKSGLGYAKSCKTSKKTFVKKFVIKLDKHGRGHLVLPLWQTKFWGHWLYGHHRMQFTLMFPCGLKVVVRFPYFNLDPQPGVVPPLLR